MSDPEPESSPSEYPNYHSPPNVPTTVEEEITGKRLESELENQI
tara:strand:+ start:420 stop:551 length:132 start_codon:yes stop_codon:yes gene_type:complete